MARFYPAGGAGGGTGSDECTAVLATDVVAGKTAVTSDSNDEAGTGGLADKNGTSQEATASLDTTNSRLQMAIPALGRYNTNSKLYAAYSKIRDLIGLTAAKIAVGVSILGITGTYKGKGTATKAQVLSGYTFSSDSLSGAAGSIATYSGSTSITPSTSAQSFPTSGKYVGSNLSVAAIPSAYQNITTSKYLFNSGSFGDISGGAAKRLYRAAEDDTGWYAGYSNDLKDPTGDLTVIGYYGVSENCMVFIELPTTQNCSGAIFRRSITFQHFKKLNIKFASFRNRSNTIYASNRGYLFAHFIPISKTPGVDAISASEFTRLQYDDGAGNYYTTLKVDTTCVIDISGINFEGYLAIGMTTYYSDDPSRFYISQIWLSQ